MNVVVHFPHAGIRALIDVEEPPAALAAGVWVLDYREPVPTERLQHAFRMDGTWVDPGNVAQSLDAIPVNAVGDSVSARRLLLRGPGPGDEFEIVEGAIPLRPLRPELEKVIGEKPLGGELWLSAEGVVLSLVAPAVIPSIKKMSAKEPVMALFRWHQGRWWWRLLAQWPRKEEAAPRLRVPLEELFGGLANGFTLRDRRELVPEFALAEERRPQLAGAETPAEPQWRPYERAPQLTGAPWWSVELSAATLRLAGPAPARAGHGATERPAGEIVTLDLRPGVLHCFRDGLEEGKAVRYVFVEEHRRGLALPAVAVSPAGALPELRLALSTVAPSPAARRVAATVAAAEKIALVPLAPGDAALAPPELWLRERDGFARLLPGAPEEARELRWPASRIPLETRETRVSAWMGGHANASFLDLWLLPDNTTRLELSFHLKTTNATANAGAVPEVELRALAPGLRLVSGAHALVQPPPIAPAGPLPEASRDAALPDSGASVTPAALPPPPRTMTAGEPLFHPLVFLPPHLAADAGQTPFHAQLAVGDQKSPLRVELTSPTVTEAWRHLPRHPAVAPVEWAGNDPEASAGLSALRGLLPVRVGEGTPLSLTPEAGGVALGYAAEAAAIPELFRDETVCLLDHPDDLWTEAELVPATGGADVLRFRRRYALPHLDYHWRRSAPSKGDAPVLPADFTWAHARHRGGEVVIPLVLALTAAAPLAPIEALRANQADDPTSDSRVQRVGQFVLGLDGGPALFHLAVRFEDDKATPARWTLTAPGGAGAATLAGLAVFPVALGEGKLTVALVPPPAPGTDEGWPFAGPGFVTLAFTGSHLKPNAAPAPLRVRLGKGRAVLPGRLFLERIAGALDAAAAEELLAVTSEQLEIRLGDPADQPPRLALGSLRFWFKVQGELFSITSGQGCVLGETAVLEGNAPLQRDAQGHFLFTVGQALFGGLTLVENLIDTTPAAKRGLHLQLAGETLAKALPADGVHELTAAPQKLLPGEPALSPDIPVRLHEITRVYLRLRRRAEGTADAAFTLLGGLVGWTTRSIFGLTRPDDSRFDPQVTLYLPEDAPRSDAGPKRATLSLNGTVAWPVASDAGGDEKLDLKLVFWDGILPLAVDPSGAALTLEAPVGGVPVSALIDADYVSPAGEKLRWSAFQTLRIDAGGALKLDGVFSVERPPNFLGGTVPSGLFIRRPDSHLRLWPGTLAVGGAGDQLGVFFAVHLVADGAADLTNPAPPDRTATFARQPESEGQLFFGVSAWHDFPLEESLRDKALGDTPGKFPGGELAGRPSAAPAGTVRTFGQVQPVAADDGDGRRVGYTLYAVAQNPAQSLWLRCPVREVIHLQESAGPVPTALWLWRGERLERIWTAERTARPAEAERLASQVLRFSRWRRNAILETPAAGNLVAWQLLDSVLLNRDYDLADFTDTAAPTGGPRFPAPGPAVAPLRADLPLGPGATPEEKMRWATFSFAPEGPASVVEHFTVRPEAPAIAPDDWQAPFFKAAVRTSLSTAPVGLRDCIVSLARSMPFLLDGAGSEWFHRWPVAAWFVGGCKPPASTAAAPADRAKDEEAKRQDRLQTSLPLAPRETLLSLETPRPGERLSFDLTALSALGDPAAAATADGHPPSDDPWRVAPGAIHSAGARSPSGRNEERITLSPPEQLPAPQPVPRFRDHLTGYRLRWVRQYPRELRPAEGTPVAVALINPDRAARSVREGEWFPLFVLVAAAEARLPGQRLFAVLAPSPAVEGAQFSFEIEVPAAADPAPASMAPVATTAAAAANEKRLRTRVPLGAGEQRAHSTTRT